MLTARNLIDMLEHGLDGRMDSRYPPLDVINDAGRHFVSMHGWRFLRGRSVQLSGKGPLQFSGLTWNESAKTLTGPASTFAAYDFLFRDMLKVTAGTGVTQPGDETDIRYTIADKPDNQTLVLEESIGAAADDETDIAIEIQFNYVTFPDHVLPVRKVEHIEPTSNLLQTTEFRTPKFVQQHRSNASAINPFGFYLTYSHEETAAGVIFPRIELWPPLSEDRPGFLTCWYQKGWKTLTDENAPIPILDYCDTLMRQLVRAFAKGYEEEEQASLNARLEEIDQGPVARYARDQDGAFFPNLGIPHGSKVQEMSFDQFFGSSPTTVPTPE
jgi:hypothetical protein